MRTVKDLRKEGIVKICKTLIISLSVMLLIFLSISSPSHENAQKKMPRYVQVPNVVGLTLEQAKVRLNSRGLHHTVKILKDFRKEYRGKEGKIIKQNPKAGRFISTTIKVELTVYDPTLLATDLRIIMPDLQTDFFWRVESGIRCKGARIEKPDISCHADVIAVINNIGPADTPTKRPGIDLELMINNKDNQEIYRELKRYPGYIKPGENGALKFRLPLIIFHKACQVKLIVDPNKQIAEKNENNNIFSKKMTFCGQDPPLPDLKMNKIWIERDQEYQKYLVKAEFENVGNDGVHHSYSGSFVIDDEIRGNPTFNIYLEYGEKYTSEMGIPVSLIPEDKRTVHVKFEINDGSRIRRFEEIDYNNNTLEAEVELPEK